MRWDRICIIALTALCLRAQGDLKLAVGITPAQNIFNRIQGPFEKATGIKLVLVATTPHALGFAPKAPQVSLKVNSPVTPAITRPVLLLIKGAKPTAKVQKLLDYLDTPEARKLTVR